MHNVLSWQLPKLCKIPHDLKEPKDQHILKLYITPCSKLVYKMHGLFLVHILCFYSFMTINQPYSKSHKLSNTITKRDNTYL